MPVRKAIANTETNCPNDIASVTAVLIDVTDPLSGAQKQRILNEMEILCKNIPQYGRIDLYVLDGNGKASRCFSMCSPGDGSNGNILFVNKEMTQMSWRKKFYDKVIERLETAIDSGGNNRSPLIEAVNAVCAESFSGRSGTTPGGSTLILVSDMVHNTRELNQYNRRSVGFSEFKGTAYFELTRPTNMKGVRGQVYYVRRPELGAIQGNAHKDFWRSYFRECGASMDFVEI
ncbi:MAG: hypothetical protein RDU24_12205 [Humidesulfovibrio sp.]|nr:hypothetical protein [Humidesulfovibrio sp.]